MSERNEPETSEESGRASRAAPREQSEGPEKRHGDGLLEGNGSRQGPDAGDARRD